MNICPLITAGFVSENVTNHQLELTEQGSKALADENLKVNLLQVASTCVLGECACVYRDAPATV